MTDKLNELALLLNTNGRQLADKTITAGFDGFIDTIVKIIRNKMPGANPDMFNTIGEFGGYITSKNGSSFSLETKQQEIKLGGNMPIMANALAKLGLPVNCIGAMGHPQLHPVFATLHTDCTLYSFAEPGTSTAMEFTDGKIILGQMDALHNAGWETIKQLIGLDQLLELFRSADLLCIVNWAEIDASTSIWKGILHDILPMYASEKKQLCFFDLADLSKRSRSEILAMLELIKTFTEYTTVTLGLNLNEARIIYEMLFKAAPKDELAAIGPPIFEALQPATLLLHTTKHAVAIDATGIHLGDSFHVAEPKINTGAGDNFNAGFCTGLLLNATPEQCVILANAVAGYYVANGYSPTQQEIITLLETID